MTECEFNCTKRPVVLLEYTEQGTPTTTKKACQEHKDMEQIHDPINVKVAEVL